MLCCEPSVFDSILSSDRPLSPERPRRLASQLASRQADIPKHVIVHAPARSSRRAAARLHQCAINSMILPSPTRARAKAPARGARSGEDVLPATFGALPARAEASPSRSSREVPGCSRPSKPACHRCPCRIALARLRLRPTRRVALWLRSPVHDELW